MVQGLTMSEQQQAAWAEAMHTGDWSVFQAYFKKK
jgi:hypothetical protein